MIVSRVISHDVVKKVFAYRQEDVEACEWVQVQGYANYSSLA